MEVGWFGIVDDGVYFLVLAFDTPTDGGGIVLHSDAVEGDGIVGRMDIFKKRILSLCHIR